MRNAENKTKQKKQQQKNNPKKPTVDFVVEKCVS